MSPCNGTGLVVAEHIQPGGFAFEDFEDEQAKKKVDQRVPQNKCVPRRGRIRLPVYQLIDSASGRRERQQGRAVEGIGMPRVAAMRLVRFLVFAWTDPDG